MSDEMELEYMTIGELADKVGVTVRTIQYYDQENLLKPSAKGSRNQRLIDVQAGLLSGKAEEWTC